MTSPPACGVQGTEATAPCSSRTIRMGQCKQLKSQGKGFYRWRLPAHCYQLGPKASEGEGD